MLLGSRSHPQVMLWNVSPIGPCLRMLIGLSKLQGPFLGMGKNSGTLQDHICPAGLDTIPVDCVHVHTGEAIGCFRRVERLVSFGSFCQRAEILPSWVKWQQPVQHGLC